MSAATSPAPWSVNNSGGAMTIVARDRSVVAVIVGSGAAAPFDVSNAHIIAAAPGLYEQLAKADALLRRIEEFFLGMKRVNRPLWVDDVQMTIAGTSGALTKAVAP